MTSLKDAQRIKALEESVEALHQAYIKANAALAALAGRLDALEARKERKAA